MKHLLFLVVILFSACAAKKQAAEFEAQPAWMKQKPIIAGYYVGIGNSKKVGTSSEYIANARKDALADLAGEVSVQISSSSVYHTIENKYGQIESFDQRIETTVDDYLEGFEPVEFYENADSYWVYFRISKATYVEMKESKKKEALSVALAKYNAGKNEEVSGKPKEALSFYLQGLQSIKPYLKEETTISTNETRIDIGNQLFSAMDQILSVLMITTDSPEIKVKRGNPFDQALRFRVQMKDKPVQGIPVEFSFTGGYLKNDRQTSDANGLVTLQPEVIHSANTQEKIIASINMKEIASKAVDDTFIRGLLLKRTLKPVMVILNIDPVTISVEIAEHCCIGEECSRLMSVFNNNATGSGFVFKSDNKGDFTFHLSYTVVPGSRAGGLVSAGLKGTLKVINESQGTIWNKEITEIRGVGANATEAREKAFMELLTSLNRNYIRQGLDKIVPSY